MKAFLRFGILIVLFIAAFAALYVSYAEVRKKSLEKLGERQMLLAKQAVTGIEEFFNSYTNMFMQYALAPEMVNFNNEGKRLIRTLYVFNKKQFRAVTRYDENGIILYTFPQRPELVGTSIADQEHVKLMLKLREPLLSDVFTALQGYRTVALNVPVYDGSVFKGVLAALVDFEYVASKYIGSISIGESGYAWMIDKEANLLFSPAHGKNLINVKFEAEKYPDSRELGDKMLMGETGFSEYTYDTTRGDRVVPVKKLAAFMPVHVLGNFWSLAVVIPEDEAYDDLSGFYKKMLFIMAVMFAAFAFYISVVFRMMKLSLMNTELAQRVAEEVEKRKEQEKMLLQQAKFTSMGEMINAIAHQWRQPLTAIGFGIQEMGEMAKEKHHTDEHLDDYVRFLMDIVMHMSETIDDFRNFFRPDKDRVELDIRRTMLAVYHIIGSQFAAAGIKVSILCETPGRKYEIHAEKDITDEDTELYTVEGFEGEAKQVFLNILQNARDAIIPRTELIKMNQGSVSVTVTPYGRYIDIDFIDNGGGIKAEFLDRVFDPYFTTKGESVGLGIGLFMSKTIIEEHMGGLLMVRNIKEGAKFTVRLNRKYPDITGGE
ncbi:sensor histidine kinase [Geovibrio thiophilus]|uniref:histidine kinase n=1 Tax=Geovibrio thiophilus TaxID=139438 RepID=A0A3R5UWV4_9BACT|nr:sensor histidine kinase [Geovibrio thiophilus]QAR32451.1 sensor histidine kinase [Geovibrio thiophilus]